MCEFLVCWVCVLVMGLSSWLHGLVCEEHEEQAKEHEQHYEKKKNLI